MYSCTLFRCEMRHIYTVRISQGGLWSIGSKFWGAEEDLTAFTASERSLPVRYTR